METVRTLFATAERFGGMWLRALRALAKQATSKQQPADMLMIGDFGKDLDDEKALTIAVALKRIGIISDISVVANLGDARLRACLAKGMLQQLGLPDVPVATGTHGGRPNEELYAHEFDHCGYLADEKELEPDDGPKLLFRALKEARSQGRRLTIVLNSSLTDMSQMMDDPRWDAQAVETIACVAAMGGMTEQDGGSLVMDPSAANNAFDVPAAKRAYDRLQEQLGARFIVVTRHAASACQMPRRALDGSMHPVAQRLSGVAKPALQTLWERVHRTAEERKEMNDSLPMRCDAPWFRGTFLESTAPADLGPKESCWPFVKGFNEYDGLTTVIAAIRSWESRHYRTFCIPTSCKRTGCQVIGLQANHPGIVNKSGRTTRLFQELMIIAFGGGGGHFRHACLLANERASPIDMLMIGDFGKDLDDEKALTIAVALKRIGIISDISVVANLGDARLRACLAKGMLQQLGLPDVPVATGTHGGRPNEELYAHEFDHCGYLADEKELEPDDGPKLLFRALKEARSQGRRLTIVLNSSLTDMSQMMDDPRWDAQAVETIACVAAMGGMTEQDGGSLVMDPSAANNAFDVPAAKRAYDRLQEQLGARFIVVTRHAASACQMPRRALDGSMHPVAQRLSGVAKPALQTLWERVHRTAEERKEMNDSLPMRCDAPWFRGTFLESTAPADLGPKESCWPFVKGFNEYDGLTTVIAVAMSYPELMTTLAKPTSCKRTGCQVIGLRADLAGVANKSGRTSELLHDLIVFAMERRFFRNMYIEWQSDDGWERYLLREPKREFGPDAWLCTENTSVACERHKILLLNEAEEGMTWRLANAMGANEPLKRDAGTGLHVRPMGGRLIPYQFGCEGALSMLRERFEPKPGDIYVYFKPRTGAGMTQQALHTLLGFGDPQNAVAGASEPLLLEAALTRGRSDIFSADKIEKHLRVFKTTMPPSLFPCVPGEDFFLPAGVKVVVPIRDPRDAVWGFFNFYAACFEEFRKDCTFEACCEAMLFNNPQKWAWGNWLEDFLEFWKEAQRRPDQVMFISWEELVEDTEATVRKLANFIGLDDLDDMAIESTVASLDFAESKRLMGGELGSAWHRQGRVGDHVGHFTPEMLDRVERELLEPARKAGMYLPPHLR